MWAEELHPFSTSMLLVGSWQALGLRGEPLLLLIMTNRVPRVAQCYPALDEGQTGAKGCSAGLGLCHSTMTLQPHTV